MSKLNSLKLLIKEIEDDTVVKRFNELEKIIDKDKKLNDDYKKLLELQKIMINQREKRSEGLTLAENNYENAKEKVLKHIVLTEYLDLLEEINYDLGLIQNIISQEINIDFE